jgi:hypothetical protein
MGDTLYKLMRLQCLWLQIYKHTEKHRKEIPNHAKIDATLDFLLELFEVMYDTYQKEEKN